MLPIRVPSFIGCPFHGLVIDGTLTLPNSQTMPYTSAVSAFTQVLRNPAGVANARARTAEEQTADTAAGRQWLDYGIRNANRFNGEALGVGKQFVLYSDPAGSVWLLVYDPILGDDTVRPRLYLKGLFGRVRHGGASPPDYSLNTLLWSAAITSSDDEAITNSFYVASLLQNETGSKVLFKIHRVIRGDVYAKRYDWVQYATSGVNAGRRLSDLYELTISGTGSTEIGTLGQGISVSAALVADFSDLYTDTSSNTGTIITDIKAECAGPFGSKVWQLTKDGSALGTSYAENTEQITEFDAKIDAYYGDSDIITYIERASRDGSEYTVSASTSASISDDGVTTTICRSLNGTEIYETVLESSVAHAGSTVSGSYLLSSSGTGPGEVCVEHPIGDNVPICSESTEFTLSMDSTTTETGSAEGAEVYFRVITNHGLIMVAQGYDDNGTKRYTRTLIAPDGNTLVIDPVDAPMDYTKMTASGVAWNPVTGQLVSYPGQSVGFV